MSAIALFAAIVLGAIGLFLASEPASAQDGPQPPKTVLIKGSKELQSGRLTDEYRWSYPSRNGNACWTDEAFDFLAFPRGLPTVAVGSTLKMRVYKGQKPRPMLTQEIDREGQPRGELAAGMRFVVRDSKTVAWDVVFSVDRPNAVYRPSCVRPAASRSSRSMPANVSSRPEVRPRGPPAPTRGRIATPTVRRVEEAGTVPTHTGPTRSAAWGWCGGSVRGRLPRAGAK